MIKVLSFPPSIAEGNLSIAATYRDLCVEEVEWQTRDLKSGFPYKVRELWRRRREFDVVAYHWGFDRGGLFLGLLSVLGPRLLGKRLIWHAHEVELSCKRSDIRRYRIGMILNYLLYKLAHGLVFYSDDARKRIEVLWGVTRKKVVCATHPPYRLPAPAPDRQTIRQKYGFGEGSFVYGFFGAVRPYKGVVRLLEAYGKVRGPDTALIIAGHFDASEPLPREDLESLLRGCDHDVHYRLNGIKDDSIPLVMALVDAVVLPYETSETSGVLYLAWEFGKPVVAFERGVWKELVTPGQGVLCTDLADGLRKVRGRVFNAEYPDELYQKSLISLNRLYQGTC